MINSFIALLAILSIALFASITGRTFGRLYIAELIFLAAFITLAVVSLVSLRDRPIAKFLLQIFFLAAIANSILLYLILPFGLVVLMGIVLAVGGLISTFAVQTEEAEEGQRKTKTKQGETKTKRTEVEKQLGPIEEEPKVIVEEAPRKPRKTRKRARRRKKR